MKSPVNAACLFFLLLCITSTAAAETRYISDQLVVTVRDNKSNNYNVLGTLLTASPVEILEEDATFVKVRTSKGIVGYVLKQYVTKPLPKAVQLAKLQKQNAALEEKLSQQLRDFQESSNLATTSQATISQLTDELNQAQQQLSNVSKEYEELQRRSENVIDLTTERDQLQEENSQIISELEVLKEENSNFHRTNMIQWFLAGGGVFFFGWLAGKISRKKRNYSRF